MIPDGIICINKPPGFTSFDVVAKLRGILKTRKLGHAGTLDPMATGVLPVLAGGATKYFDAFLLYKKRYLAGFRLGISTDTFDITGSIEKTSDPSGTDADVLKRALEGFVGEIFQLPPMYSAKRVDGQRLYKLAMNGIKDVPRSKKKVTVYDARLVSFDAADFSGKLDVICSGGTYIRTIIGDLGEKLGCGGVMTSLVRTQCCGLTLDDCITLEELEGKTPEELNKIIIPTDKALARQ